MYKTTVSVIKVIQLRVERVKEDGTVIHGWNKKYQKPSIAARAWASDKAREWERTHFANYHQMTPQDYEVRDRWEQKLYRRALPIFRKMIAP